MSRNGSSHRDNRGPERLCEVVLEDFTPSGGCRRAATRQMYPAGPHPPGWNRWFYICDPCLSELGLEVARTRRL